MNNMFILAGLCRERMSDERKMEVCANVHAGNAILELFVTDDGYQFILMFALQDIFRCAVLGCLILRCKAERIEVGVLRWLVSSFYGGPCTKPNLELSRNLKNTAFSISVFVELASPVQNLDVLELRFRPQRLHVFFCARWPRRDAGERNNVSNCQRKTWLLLSTQCCRCFQKIAFLQVTWFILSPGRGKSNGIWVHDSVQISWSNFRPPHDSPCLPPWVVLHWAMLWVWPWWGVEARLCAVVVQGMQLLVYTQTRSKSK